MTFFKNTKNSLSGQLLVAMPGISDPRFEKLVIYVCAHSSDGAMGLIINKPSDAISFPDLLEQLGISNCSGTNRIGIQCGGPVEVSRGFVLHSPDYMREATLFVDDNMALTANLDILRAIADGTGPRRFLLALGYAGWVPDQLDTEILNNGWLTVDADDDLVFGEELDCKWSQAMTKIGIDLRFLSDEAGHA